MNGYLLAMYSASTELPTTGPLREKKLLVLDLFSVPYRANIYQQIQSFSAVFTVYETSSN